MYETAASLNPSDPWLSIWTGSRATIRHLLDVNPTRNVMGAAVLAIWFIVVLLLPLGAEKLRWLSPAGPEMHETLPALRSG